MAVGDKYRALHARSLSDPEGFWAEQAAAIDWTQTNIQQFHIRQRPGSRNALGQVKFLFPNQHDIYLHDTPSRDLFSRNPGNAPVGAYNISEVRDAYLNINKQLVRGYDLNLRWDGDFNFGKRQQTAQDQRGPSPRQHSHSSLQIPAGRDESLARCG